jgi:hypothetical protein
MKSGLRIIEVPVLPSKVPRFSMKSWFAPLCPTVPALSGVSGNLGRHHLPFLSTLEHLKAGLYIFNVPLC